MQATMFRALSALFIALVVFSLVFLGWMIGARAQQAAAVSVTLTEAELNAQLKLNSAACKAVGLDDGGQACAAGQALNAKLLEAHKASKSAPPASAP